jgi:prephenate dehydratase
VLAGDVGDHPEAYTRFVSVSTYTRIDREAEEWRTAFTFVTDHSPGALYRAIEPFGRLRIDLHQLVSRPIPRTPWRYRFDSVLAGHPLDPIVSEALRELRENTRRLQVFGSYPARRDVEDE